MPLLRRPAGFTLIELLIVIGIIAILALMTLPSFIERSVRDQVVEALPIADVAKPPVALAWSNGDQLPADNKAAGLPVPDKIVGNYVSATTLQDGAINVTFGNRASTNLRGKTLTLRPAVVPDSPIVPIAWVCGNAAVPDKMTVKGVNKTDVPVIFLPMKCR
jgi:type IV pilus assembly protein PilA